MILRGVAFNFFLVNVWKYRCIVKDFLFPVILVHRISCLAIPLEVIEFDGVEKYQNFFLRS